MSDLTQNAALIEAVAEAIMGGKERAALVVVRNPGEAFNAHRDAHAAVAAVVEHLGLTEEWERWCGGWKPTTAGAAEVFREKATVPSQRQTRVRLVTPWQEVQP